MTTVLGCLGLLVAAFGWLSDRLWPEGTDTLDRRHDG